MWKIVVYNIYIYTKHISTSENGAEAALLSEHVRSLPKTHSYLLPKSVLNMTVMDPA